jgi:ribosomal protein L12E/L44/L45/RPP1/RPP2
MLVLSAHDELYVCAAVYHCTAAYCVWGECRWQAVSATLKVLVSAGKHAQHALQDVVVQGFDMAFADTALDSVRTASVAAEAKRQAEEEAVERSAHTEENSEETSSQTMDGDLLELRGGASTAIVEPYLLASSLNMHLKDGEIESQSAPSIVVTRGIEIKEQFTTEFAAKQVLALCCVLVLDGFMLLLATALFLSPLEKVSAAFIILAIRYFSGRQLLAIIAIAAVIAVF